MIPINQKPFIKLLHRIVQENIHVHIANFSQNLKIIGLLRKFCE